MQESLNLYWIVFIKGSFPPCAHIKLLLFMLSKLQKDGIYYVCSVYVYVHILYIILCILLIMLYRLCTYL